MSRYIFIDKGLFETRCALIENDTLVDLSLSDQLKPSLVGAVYLGRISGHAKDMQAAFLDLGNGLDGLLLGRHSKADAKDKKKQKAISTLLPEGSKMLVQVTKDALDGKSPQLSAFPVLEGQFLSLKPLSSGVNFSRKMKGSDQEALITEKLSSITGGVTIRTRAMTADLDKINAEYTQLDDLWQTAEQAKKENQKPSCLIPPPHPALLFAERNWTEGTEIIVNDRDLYQDLTQAFAAIAPGDVYLWNQKQPIFDEFDMEDQIDTTFDMRLDLRAGGNLTIEQTEALVAIDVNATSSGSGAAIKSSLQKANAEACRIIASQLRLRNLSGMILIDFAGKQNRGEAGELTRILRQQTKNDPCRVDVLGASELGLMQLTRQRKQPPLEHHFRRHIGSADTAINIGLAGAIMRDLSRYGADQKSASLRVQCGTDIHAFLTGHQAQIEQYLSLSLIVEIASDMRSSHYDISDARH
jgi:ribonuclease G